MAEELAPQYLSSSNLQTEIQPISTRIDEMLLRLEEFENLLVLVREESAVAGQQNIPRIAAFRPEFDSLCERLDQLEKFVAMVSKNLDVVERQVQIAEEELDIPDKTINVLLKSLNIFGKPRPVERQTNRNAHGMYEAPTIFKTEDYFGGKAKAKASGSSATVSAGEEGSCSKTPLEEDAADENEGAKK
uniref:Putative bioproteinsis of lysosome-related organelles complex 1 subunit 4 n=1 Tax=Culex tarsalis TaxID=7177 RepID=A0A1Q3F9N0_CULTA